MTKYGHDVLVVHRDEETLCTCVDKLTGSINRDCPFCFGTGYVSIVRKHTTRTEDKQVDTNHPFLGDNFSFGELTIEGRSYYFYKDVPIKEHDLIVEVDWQGNQPIYNGGGIYEVNHKFPYRFEGGQIAFWKTFVKDKPVMKNIRGFKIVQSAKETLYHMAERK